MISLTFVLTDTNNYNPDELITEIAMFLTDKFEVVPERIKAAFLNEADILKAISTSSTKLSLVETGLKEKEGMAANPVYQALVYFKKVFNIDNIDMPELTLKLALYRKVDLFFIDHSKFDKSFYNAIKIIGEATQEEISKCLQYTNVLKRHIRVIKQVYRKRISLHHT